MIAATITAASMNVQIGGSEPGFRQARRPNFRAVCVDVAGDVIEPAAVPVGQTGEVEFLQKLRAAQPLGEVLAGHGDEETAVWF